MAKGKYARKRLLRELREHSLEDYGLSRRVVEILKKSNIKTAADLHLLSDDEIHNISGIGEKALDEIKKIRTQFIPK